jgi:hypothetical protein
MMMIRSLSSSFIHRGDKSDKQKTRKRRQKSSSSCLRGVRIGRGEDNNNH